MTSTARQLWRGAALLVAAAALLVCAWGWYAYTAPGRPGLVVLLNLGLAAHTLQVTLPPGATLAGTPRDLLADLPLTAEEGGLQATLPPLSAAIVGLAPAP